MTTNNDEIKNKFEQKMNNIFGYADMVELIEQAIDSYKERAEHWQNKDKMMVPDKIIYWASTNQATQYADLMCEYEEHHDFVEEFGEDEIYELLYDYFEKIAEEIMEVKNDTE